MLNDEQKEQYKKNESFIVEGSSGAKWRISKRTPALKLLEGPKDLPILNFCIIASTHSASRLPAADKLIFLKLMAESDDSDLLTRYSSFSAVARNRLRRHGEYSYDHLIRVRNEAKALVAQRQRRPT